MQLAPYLGARALSKDQLTGPIVQLRNTRIFPKSEPVLFSCLFGLPLRLEHFSR
jgi:hypothetical protein